MNSGKFEFNKQDALHFAWFFLKNFVPVLLTYQAYIAGYITDPTLGVYFSMAIKFIEQWAKDNNIVDNKEKQV